MLPDMPDFLHSAYIVRHEGHSPADTAVTACVMVMQFCQGQVWSDLAHTTGRGNRVCQASKGLLCMPWFQAGVKGSEQVVVHTM